MTSENVRPPQVEHGVLSGLAIFHSSDVRIPLFGSWSLFEISTKVNSDEKSKCPRCKGSGALY